MTRPAPSDFRRVSEDEYERVVSNGGHYFVGYGEPIVFDIYSPFETYVVLPKAVVRPRFWPPIFRFARVGGYFSRYHYDCDRQ